MKVSYRALAVGLVVAALLGIGAPYENMIVTGSPLHLDYSTPAALFFFFLFLILVNPLLTLLRRQWRFNQVELVVVYVMAAVACTVPTAGLVCVLIAHISGGLYYTTPENEWDKQVAPYIQSWLQVGDEEAVKFFYEGLPQGHAIPWDAWVAPLAAWMVLALALFGVVTALMVLVRKQWIEHERLTFPLVQVPIALIGEEGESASKSFFRNATVWIGIAVPVLLYSQRALHNYFPFLPEGMPISTSYYFWNDKFRLRLAISYAVVGFGYLLSTKLGFSLWFLGLLTMFEHAALHHFGLSGTDRVVGSSLGSPNLLYQGFGALAALTLSSAWMGRRHLQEVARKIWNNSSAVDDSREILSYRQAALLLLICGATMAIWCYLAGFDGWLVPAFLLVTFLLMIGITRIVAEGGLAVTRPTMMPNDVMIGAFGSNTLGPSNLGGLGMAYAWAGEMRTTVMSAVIHGLKLLEDYSATHRKRLFWGIVLAALTATVAAIGTVLVLGYRYGALNQAGWFFGVGQATKPFAYVAYHLSNPKAPSADFYTVSGLGAAVQFLLTLCHARFLWWPIHPIAFPVSAFWTTHHLMPSIFVAWMVKVVVLRYGGVSLYRKTRPFFLGMILGHCIAGGLWVVIDAFTGMTANYLFYW